ncbi:MAG: CvpA family protein [Alphaproteobacteria bacterium]|nr:CvpA family protein [Alphaproteobacteria bacterium]
MPFQILDIALIGIMLISGLLALMRGFTREVLALITWGGAAAAGYLAYQSEPLQQLAKQYIESDIVAKIALVGSVFLIVLIVVSLITMKLADWILDSGIGALDRTLGFVFGLARGLLLVAVAYIFFIYWVPPDRAPTWVKRAQTLSFVDQTSTYIIGILPPEIQDVLLPKTIEGRRRAGAGTTGKQDSQSIEQNESGTTGDSLNNSNRQDLNQTIENQQTQ